MFFIMWFFGFWVKVFVVVFFVFFCVLWVSGIVVYVYEFFKDFSFSFREFCYFYYFDNFKVCNFLIWNF